MAIMVEEGTTNLITDPTYANAASWPTKTNAIFKTSGGFIQDTCMSLCEGVTGTGYCYQSQTLLAGETGAFSVYVKMSDNSEPLIGDAANHMSLVFGGSRITTHKEEIGNNWWRLTGTKTVSSDTTGNTGIVFFLADNTIYPIFSNIQFEKKAYVTSWHDGTRSPETLIIPTEGVLDPQEGTVELTVIPNLPSSVAPSGVGFHDLVWMTSDAAKGFILRRKQNSIELLSRRDTGHQSQSYSFSWNAGDKIASAVKWDSEKVYLLVNGQRVITLDKFDDPGNIDLHVGCRADAGIQGNALYDDLRASSKGRTDEEIAAANDSGEPLEVDESTTYKLSFDGHLQPTVRRFGLWLASGEIGVGATIAGNAASDLETKTGAQGKVDTHNALQSPHNLPSYTKMQSDGFKVYDDLSNLRCHMGQYEAGEYGIKIINGKIFSTTIRSGSETSSSYIEISSGFEPFLVVENGNDALSIWSTNGGMIQFFDTAADDMRGQILPYDDAVGYGLRIDGRTNTGGQMPVHIDGLGVIITGQSISLNDTYFSGDTDVTVWGDLTVHGDLSATGSKPARQPTVNYGERYLYARESPEVRYIDEGIGELVNGECKINIDPIFLECIEPNTENTPWLVHLTPMANIQLYVDEIGESYILVRSAEAVNARFFWSLSCVRKGFAGIRLEQVESDEDVLTSNWEDDLGV